MKGATILCLKEFVSSKYGLDVWNRCVSRAGLPRNIGIVPREIIKDEDFMKIVTELSKEISMKELEILENFGYFWVINCLSGRQIYYDVVGIADNLRKYLEIYQAIGQPGGYRRPPRGRPSKVNVAFISKDHVLVSLDYDVDVSYIYVGILRALADLYKESDVTIERSGYNRVKIIFG